MDASELRERLTKRLVDEIDDLTYPSTAMLDRAEERLQGREALARYIESLVKKVEATQFPSVSMLKRLDALLARLEQVEQREQAQAAGHG